jgi:obg-like ATPase 1
MQVDGLYHLVRAFGGEEVAHTEGSMDAVRDVEIIRNELIFKDREVMEKKVKEIGRKAAKSQDRAFREEFEVIQKAYSCLKDSKMEVRLLDWTPREVESLNKFALLTAKPMVYLINLSREDYLKGQVPNQEAIERVITFDGKHPAKIIPYSV